MEQELSCRLCRTPARPHITARNDKVTPIARSIRGTSSCQKHLASVISNRSGAWSIAGSATALHCCVRGRAWCFRRRYLPDSRRRFRPFSIQRAGAVDLHLVPLDRLSGCRLVVAHMVPRTRFSARRQAHRCIDLVGLDADSRNRSVVRRDSTPQISRGPQGQYDTLKDVFPLCQRQRSAGAADLSRGKKLRRNLAVLSLCRGVAAMSHNLEQIGLTEEARTAFIPLAVIRPRQPPWSAV